MTGKNNIVPIIYNAGTGGNFLAYILDSALIGRNLSEPIKFTKYGSAHLLQRYFIYWINMTDSPDIHVSEYLNYARSISHFELEADRKDKSHEWIFLAFHSIHVKDIMKHATKGVLITYDNDDIPEIMKAFIGKSCLDGHHLPTGDYYHTPIEDITSLTNTYNKHYSTLSEYQSYFNAVHNFDDSLLNLSWKELMYEGIPVLIEKLSKFTEIPSYNFNTTAIHEWRKLTSFCISDLSALIQQLQRGSDQIS